MNRTVGIDPIKANTSLPLSPSLLSNFNEAENTDLNSSTTIYFFWKKQQNICFHILQWKDISLNIVKLTPILLTFMTWIYVW